MNKEKIIQISNAVSEMDGYLRSTLSDVQLFENTYIAKQITRREKGEDVFSIQDHIRAMVYSMLSAGIKWERVSTGIDKASGKITEIDNAFHQYDTDYLLHCEPAELRNEVKELGYATQSTLKQMTALVKDNIPKMLTLERDHGGIDNFYKRIITIDPSLKTLVLLLSTDGSAFKYSQMQGALTAEYLKNIGHSLAKPDRHIRRILGGDCLGCSEKEEVPLYEAFDIVSDIARAMKKSSAEVDYILWSYCANGYGEICTKLNPKCCDCVAKENCEKRKEIAL